MNLRDIGKKLSEVFNNAKQNITQSVNDNQGWVRQGKFTPVKQISDVGQNVGDYFNPTSNNGNNFWSTPVAKIPAFAQKTAQMAEDIPRIKLNIPQVKTVSKGFDLVVNAIPNFATGVVEDVINTPGNYIKGIARTGNYLGEMARGDSKFDTGRMIRSVSPTVEAIFDVATFGSGKKVVKDLTKDLGKKTFTKMVLKGAGEGAKFGGASSFLRASSDQGKNNFNWDQIFQDTLSGTVGGGMFGGLIGGAGFGIGEVKKVLADNLMKKNPRLTTDEALKVVDQIPRDKFGRFTQKIEQKVKYPGLNESEYNEIKTFEKRKFIQDQNGNLKGVGGQPSIDDRQNKKLIQLKPKDEMGTVFVNPNPLNKINDQDLNRYNFLVEKNKKALQQRESGKIDFEAEINIGKNSPTKKEVSEINKITTEPLLLKQNQSQPSITQHTINKFIKGEDTVKILEGLDNQSKTGVNIIKKSPTIKIKPTEEVGIRVLNNRVNREIKTSAPTISNPTIQSPQSTLLTPVSSPQSVPQFKKILIADSKLGKEISGYSKSLENAADRSMNNEFGLLRPDQYLRQQQKKMPGLDIEAERSLFEEVGATLNKKNYANLQKKTVKLQSEASRKAELEANQYFKDISIPAYKQGHVNLGDKLPADELLKTTKDKVAFAYQRETIQRNIEDIFGKNSQMKKFVVDNITNNENKSVQFQNDLRTKLGKTFQSLGIKKGSKQDYAAADFIEGNFSLEELKAAFPKNWQGIIKASEEGRSVYKNMLGQINEQLTRFGYEPIPERQNYVTHTTQLQTFADKIGNLFNLNSSELPRTMAGINVETKPGKKFFSFGLQRKGGSTHEGLITALDKYIPSASRQIFHTEDIQRGRAILDFLQKSADEGDTRLSGFTSYLSQYVDHLAGKQNIIDRPVEKIFGRKFLEVGNWVRQRTGANMVGANLSSAITNFIPFTQSVATTSKPSFARGLLEAATNYSKEPSFIDGVQSGFLLRRFAKERITGNLGENIQDVASLPFKFVDKFTSTAIVAGKYFEQLSKGLSKEKAMALADDYAQRVMADRSFGQSPLLFNSKTLGALTQFQLEVNNQMSFLAKDIPQNMGYTKFQVVSSLVQFAVFSYLFNNLYEKVTGRRPQIDPINAGLETANDLKKGEGLQSFNPMNKFGPGFTDDTGMGQMLNQLPFTSIVSGGRIPITSAFQSPQYYLLPPFGGGQLKKTIEGVQSYNKGYSENASGNIQFPIEKNLTNAVKTATLGKYSTPEAVRYFKNNEKVLSDKQAEIFKESPDKKTAYEDLMVKRDLTSKENKIKDQVKKTGETSTFNGKIYFRTKELDPDTGKMRDTVNSLDTKTKTPELKLTGNKTIDDKLKTQYKNDLTKQATNQLKIDSAGKVDNKEKNQIIYKDGDTYKMVDLTPIEYPTLTGNSIVDKKLKSAYYSDINSQINGVIKLYQAGQISQDEMEVLVTDLNTKYTAGKSKKPKKITIKFTKYESPKSTVKISSSKSPKIVFKKSPTVKITAQKERKFTIKA